MYLCRVIYKFTIMKKIAFSILATAFLLSCNSNKVGYETFGISGKIKDLGDESIVLRYRFDGTTYFDTIKANNDVISFKKDIKLPHPLMATLTYIGTNHSPLVPSTEFFIDNGISIVLDGNLDDLFNLKAKNSPFFSDVVRFREENKGNAHSDNVQKFIENNPNSVYAAYLYTITMSRRSAEEVEDFFNRLSLNVQNSAFGKIIHTFMETAKRTAPGQPAPNFTQKDINGNTVTLEQFRDNYVMLVFWGSWCGPCRRSHPHLMEWLNKYKGSPLQVIGFASDKDRDAWKKAIADDQLDFIHCNLFDRPNGENVQTMYNIRNFPTKVFIDPQGRMVGTVVGAGDAEKKIMEDWLTNAFGR